MFRQLLTQNRKVLGSLSGFEYRPTQATTSGTEFDFSDITTFATRLTLVLNGSSLSGTDEMIVQLGTSAGLITTGYQGATGDAAGANANTTGILLQSGGAAANLYSGLCILTLYDLTNNIWGAAVNIGASTASANYGGSLIALPGRADRLRLTRNGTDTFDAGSVGLVIET